MSKTEKKRSVAIPLSLWRWCKEYADARGTSAASVVRLAVIEKKNRETSPPPQETKK